MSYSSEITGLDLFEMPFRRTQVSRSAPASSQQVSQPQRTQASASRPKTQASAQPVKPPAAQAQQAGIPEKPAPETKAPAPQEKTPDKNPEPVQEQQPQTDTPDSLEKPTPTDTPSQQQPPKKELTLDMSDRTIPAGKPLDESEEAKRKAHEESEAKRREEWEAKQLAKKQVEEAAIEELKAMSDDDVVSASTECIRVAVERITRRNMKECVADHIQSLCRKDPAFARRTMHPKKSMVHCFQYINRMAKEYIRQEMEENGIQPDAGGYGSDIPDDICYQWAVDYFNDPDAPEDQVKEEKFVPKPYVGSSSKTKKTAKSKKAAKTTKKETKKKAEPESGYQQMSLMGV